jgi:hypothetical protein
MALARLNGSSWGLRWPNVALGVYVQQENFFSFQRKTGPQVVDGGAFANSTLLIRYAYHFRFRHLGVLLS